MMSTSIGNLVSPSLLSSFVEITMSGAQSSDHSGPSPITNSRTYSTAIQTSDNSAI